QPGQDALGEEPALSEQRDGDDDPRRPPVVRRVVPTGAVELLTRGACLAACALALGAATEAAASASAAPRLSGNGAWTLERLGFAPRVVTGAETGRRPFVTQSFAFVLPAGAHQGGGSWWKLRLHVR